MTELNAQDLGTLLAEQAAYYRACAPEYDAGVLHLPGADEVLAALGAFTPTGDVLELACGTGTFTRHLLDYADRVTAVDASSEMIAQAARRVGNDPRVTFLVADLFDWRPERRYDAVVFGFWLSHVPMERFRGFWSLVRDCLVPGGRVFFADDSYRTTYELIYGPESGTIERRVTNGTRFRLVKVPHAAATLTTRLGELGWNVDVHETRGPFYWGAGTTEPEC